MYSLDAKGNYLNPIAFYKSEMEEQLEQEQAIINEMYTALEDNQFAVFIQPKYNLNSNRPSGGEALIRWNHPVKGMLSPDKFIPIFEKMDLLQSSTTSSGSKYVSCCTHGLIKESIQHLYLLMYQEQIYIIQILCKSLMIWSRNMKYRTTYSRLK